MQISYAIGVAEPTSVNVNSFGTAKVDETELQRLVHECFDLRPGGIIKELNLLRPIYQKTASYGHFGRNEPEFTWEACNKVDCLKEFIKQEEAIA